jgi:hypothetical protein
MNKPKKYGTDEKITVYLSMDELNFLFGFTEKYKDDCSACIKKLIKHHKKLKKEKKGKIKDQD